jgi:hypothetical protein
MDVESSHVSIERIASKHADNVERCEPGQTCARLARTHAYLTVTPAAVGTVVRHLACFSLVISCHLGAVSAVVQQHW